MCIIVDANRLGDFLADPAKPDTARATGVRLLYTNDPNLVVDFTNKKFIDRPRGKVYSRAANANLLTRAACSRVRG